SQPMLVCRTQGSFSYPMRAGKGMRRVIYRVPVFLGIWRPLRGHVFELVKHGDDATEQHKPPHRLSPESVRRLQPRVLSTVSLHATFRKEMRSQTRAPMARSPP